MVLLAFVCSPTSPAQRRASTVAPSANRSITLHSQPNAVVWIDEVRRGMTDATGTLVVKNISAGRHNLRLRAVGFRESSTMLRPAARGSITVRLIRLTDPGELAFQQAELARDDARDENARRRAVELYRNGIKLRPRSAVAHLGLARVLLELNDYPGALEEIDAAHTFRTSYAEASAVEGRILRASADNDAAIEAFQRAIDEAKGFQPEAHTGLALVYQDKGQYEEAAAEYRKAIAQLSDTEPVIYQLLGAVYEKQEKYKEAVAAYEKYLELTPEGNLASAIRSVMDQLRKQAEGRDGLPY